MILFDTAIQLVIRRISQVPGTSVQVYAEERIGDMIQHKFDVLFEEVWWNQFLHWQAATLDGTTGVVTIDLSTLTLNGADIGLKRFEDLERVIPGTRNRGLKRFPDVINPDNVTGDVPRFLEAIGDATKVFRVLPITAVGALNIHYRSKPNDFALGDSINFDTQALVLGAAADYLDDDGTNPGATDKMSGYFESRIKQLKKSRSWLPHALDPRITDTVDDFFEVSG